MRTKISLTIAFVFAMWAGASAQSTFFDGVSDDAESQAVMKQAAADIEKYRKGDFSFRVADQKGNPIKGAKVEATLSHHLFDFGTNLGGVMPLKDDNPLKKTAQETILDIFNMVVVVNYWYHPMNDPHTEMIRKNIDWARENGLRMRFHAILFPQTKEMETFFDKNHTTEQYWENIEERIQYIADATGGDLAEYDVINEMVTNSMGNNNDFMEIFPNFPDFTDPQVVRRIFDLTRKYFPDTKLVGLESPMVLSINNEVNMSIIEYWKRCLAAGADIDLVGVQGHFFNYTLDYREGHPKFGPGAFTMQEINLALDTLRSIGRPIVITEFTGPSRNKTHRPETRERLWTISDAENAAWQINFYRLAFSKPYIEGLTRWNHIDGYFGRGMDAGILTGTGEKHQIYDDLRKLIREEWHTREALTTTKDGKASFRGFYGDYIISVDGYKPAKVRLDKNSGEMVVTLEKKSNQYEFE